MTATQSIDLPGWMAEQLSEASPDLLRDMMQTFAEALMSADADAVCGAGYGQRNPDRTNTRNGYRRRGWDTRAGSIDLAIPKLRQGSYFPGWLLERHRRAESALVSVVATSYLLGVSTRRMEKLVETLGVTPAGSPSSATWFCRAPRHGMCRPLARPDLRAGRLPRLLVHDIRPDWWVRQGGPRSSHAITLGPLPGSRAAKLAGNDRSSDHAVS